MGQQQLLLIVLGVIVVGIAIVAGIGMFSAGSQSAAKNAVVSDLMNLSSDAQQYFRKPKAMAGGGNSFVNYAIPTILQSSVSGTYTIKTAGTATSIVLNGAPIDPTYTWHFESTVYKDSVQTVAR